MAFIAGLLMAFITLAICYSVVMRYFFKSPSIWVVQTCEYALLWMVFLGTTWLLRERGHVAVDIIYSRLRERSRAFLNSITFSLAGIACAIIVFFGTHYTWQTVIYHITDVRAVTVPKYMVFVIIPFGSLLLCIQFFRMVWEEVHHIRTSKE
jgi:TRAP-type C4-dicarboxylate transport system permease small subunit